MMPIYFLAVFLVYVTAGVCTSWPELSADILVGCLLAAWAGGMVALLRWAARRDQRARDQTPERGTVRAPPTPPARSSCPLDLDTLFDG